MSKICMTCAALAALVGTAAQAQDSIRWAAPMSTQQASQTMYFPIGTALKLVTRTELSTKFNKPGDRVYLEVAEPLAWQGQVVLPRGSLAVGEVARVQRNGHFGRKGKLGIRLLYVQSPGGPLKISGQASDEGISGTVVSFATIAFVSVLGFLVHGTSAAIPPSSPVDAYLIDQLAFRPGDQAAQVAMVQASPDDAVAGLAVPVVPQRLPARFSASTQTAPGFRSVQR